MSEQHNKKECEQAELISAFAIQAVPASDIAAVEAHLASCSQCRDELEALRAVADSFVSWPTDILRPSQSLQDRLAQRIAAETRAELVLAPPRQWSEPAWKKVAPGISCQLLATDLERARVSMLVRLTPGTHYPAHEHAAVEELYLLDGELWIDDRKLYPGDHNHAKSGSIDERVWSETGCTCVLITSTRDILR